MTRAPTNMGASVRARLPKLAKERREDFQLLLSRDRELLGLGDPAEPRSDLRGRATS